LITLNAPSQVIHLALAINPSEARKPDDMGRYPLSLVAGSKAYTRRTLSLLLRLFPDAIRATDAFGRLPLHWAAISGRHAIDGIEYDLFRAYPAAIETQDKYGMYPFMLAAESDEACVDTIYMLLREVPSTLRLCRYNQAA